MQSPSFTNTLPWVSVRTLKNGWRAAALLLAGIYAWAAASSHSMNADGISYLDIGDAYMRGDWSSAISTVWSPLYSWILGPLMALINPSMEWEFPLVHLINFVIYAWALFCFEYFWRQCWVSMQSRRDDQAGLLTWPEWAWWSIGYLLFIWTSLVLIEIWAVTPDMLMASLVYLAGGQLVKILRGDTSRKLFLTFGLTLGLSYLAKAIMFPVSLVFLGAALLSLGDPRLAVSRALVGLGAFFAVSLPFILLVSQAAGGLTIGEAGEITYVRYVNGVRYPHWQGDPPDNGVPLHPSRQIFDNPPIYEFGDPIRATYPIGYNPVYWYEGVEASVDLPQQLRLATASVVYYADLFFVRLGAVFVTALLLLIVSRKDKFSFTGFLRSWGIALPALAAFGLYALILVEGRYIGVFVVLFLAAVLSNIALPDRQLSARLYLAGAAVMVVALAVSLTLFSIEGYLDLNRNQIDPPPTGSRPPGWPGEVAQELQQLGINPGEPVGVIGYGFDSYWARLAKVRIVAEMLDVDAEALWLADEELQTRVVEAFAAAGADAIVAEYVPDHASLVGWHRVNDSNFFIYLSPPHE